MTNTGGFSAFFDRIVLIDWRKTFSVELIASLQPSELSEYNPDPSSPYGI